MRIGLDLTLKSALKTGPSDVIAPTVVITLSDYAFKIGDTAVATFTFSEAPTGFTEADVTAPNGSLSSFGVTGDPLVYTAIFTPTASVTDPTNVITVGTGWTDAAGNPPAGATNSDNYTVDTTAPTVASFTATTPASSLTITITAFTASEAGVYFIITESSTPPAIGAEGWNLTAPTTYIVAANGNYTLYPWVKDAAGNVSSIYGSPVSVNVSTLLAGLISYWKMDEESDGSINVTRVDSLATHNLASNNTIPSATGLISNCASLTAASSEFLSVADHVDFRAVPGTPMEFAFWVKQASAAYAMLLTKYDGSASSEYYLQLYADGRIIFDVWGGGASHNQNSQASKIAGSFSSGNWHIIYCGMNSDNKAFLQVDNGALTVAANAITDEYTAWRAPLKFGSRNSADYYGGLIDEAGFWRGRTLTPTERTELLNGGSGITHPFDSPAGGSGFQVNSATASRAANPLTTPTYDESGQAVHPDVYDAGSGNTWNGKRYWMAMTPYPAANEALENPSILCSDDGNTWIVPAELTNPVIPAVGGATYNSDCDILVDGATMWLMYRTHNDTTHDEKIYVLSSTDGVTWGEATEILSSTVTTAILSPAIVKVGSTFYMYSVDATGHYNDNLIYFVNRRSCSTMDGTWSAPQLVSFPIYTHMPSGKIRPTNPWHINVMYTVDGEYFALLTTWDYKLIIGKSTDGINFKTGLSTLLTTATGGWDDNLYRSSIVRTATGFDLWYSAQDGETPQAWQIGRTAITIPFVEQ